MSECVCVDESKCANWLRKHHQIWFDQLNFEHAPKKNSKNRCFSIFHTRIKATWNVKLEFLPHATKQTVDSSALSQSPSSLLFSLFFSFAQFTNSINGMKSVQNQKQLNLPCYWLQNRLTPSIYSIWFNSIQNTHTQLKFEFLAVVVFVLFFLVQCTLLDERLLNTAGEGGVLHCLHKIATFWMCWMRWQRRYLTVNSCFDAWKCQTYLFCSHTKHTYSHRIKDSFQTIKILVFAISHRFIGVDRLFLFPSHGLVLLGHFATFDFGDVTTIFVWVFAVAFSHRFIVYTRTHNNFGFVSNPKKFPEQIQLSQILFFWQAIGKTRNTLTMSHTILLVQPGTRPETRTYSDYESVNECMEGVCKIYEEHLKRRNPNTPTITYDISQLFDFLDQVNKLVYSWHYLLLFAIVICPSMWWNTNVRLLLLLFSLIAVGRFELLGLSKIHQHIRTVQ